MVNFIQQLQKELIKLLTNLLIVALSLSSSSLPSSSLSSSSLSSSSLSSSSLSSFLLQLRVMPSFLLKSNTHKYKFLSHFNAYNSEFPKIFIFLSIESTCTLHLFTQIWFATFTHRFLQTGATSSVIDALLIYSLKHTHAHADTNWSEKSDSRPTFIRSLRDTPLTNVEQWMIYEPRTPSRSNLSYWTIDRVNARRTRSDDITSSRSLLHRFSICVCTR